ncbi:MAG: aminotransferase class IV [Bacteroidales bacterium]
MCRFIETIRIEGRRLQNLRYHRQRMAETFRIFYPGSAVPITEEVISIPASLGEGVYKCRILYGREVEKVEFEPYHEKMINTLKMVDAGTLDYSHKYADRSSISRLMERRESCDDILMVKNGRITDTSYCNILFFDGKKWFTPDRPLLPGTMRKSLLDAGKIQAVSVEPASLPAFTQFMLVNAMLVFDESRAKDISGIIL